MVDTGSSLSLKKARIETTSIKNEKNAKFCNRIYLHDCFVPGIDNSTSIDFETRVLRPLSSFGQHHAAQFPKYLQLHATMVSQRLSNLSAVRKQHLLVELYVESSLNTFHYLANSLLQLKSQVRLPSWCLHEPHSRRPNTLVWRNLCTKR
jgi:hypothetical protein